jgi:hypothetical protein
MERCLACEADAVNTAGLPFREQETFLCLHDQSRLDFRAAIDTM